MTIIGEICYYRFKQERRGQSSDKWKEVRPMSIAETIALLTLVIAAIRLGIEIKK